MPLLDLSGRKSTYHAFQQVREANLASTPDACFKNLIFRVKFRVTLAMCLTLNWRAALTHLFALLVTLAHQPKWARGYGTSCTVTRRKQNAETFEADAGHFTSESTPTDHNQLCIVCLKKCAEITRCHNRDSIFPLMRCSCFITTDEKYM